MKRVELSAGKLLNENKVYIAVDNAQKYMKWLYQHNPAPEMEFLFSQTSLQTAQLSGPMVFSFSVENDLNWLLASVASDNEMSVMLFQSHLSMASLLDVLRRNLLVTFQGNKVAVFRFYDRFVASYFFRASIEYHQFVGIEHIYWFGNTYKGYHLDGNCWWSSAIQTEPTQMFNEDNLLSQQQSQCLEIMLREQFIEQSYRQNSEQFTFEEINGNLSKLIKIYQFQSEKNLKQALQLVLINQFFPTAESQYFINSSKDEQQKITRFVHVMKELEYGI